MNTDQTPSDQLDITDVSADIKYDKQFLEKLVGPKILTNPVVALIELLANSWDAGATRVDIEWKGSKFSIKDNGEGMTKEEFQHRWNTLSYNRLAEQGPVVSITNNPTAKRNVYGRNGVGRFASFCFSDEFEVQTSKNGVLSSFNIRRSTDDEYPFYVIFNSQEDSKKSGTTIRADSNKHSLLSEQQLKLDIALRFMGDPTFNVYINGEKVKLDDIPKDQLNSYNVDIPNFGQLEIHIIDTEKSDRTAKMHGIAFHVNKRLVGDITWKHYGLNEYIDGRSIEGRRLLVIVNADFLLNHDIIKQDWTGFNYEHPIYRLMISKVEETIQKYLSYFLEEQRAETFTRAKENSQLYLNNVTRSQRSKWENFINLVQIHCRSIRDDEIVKLGELLAKLEASNSRYAILSQLSDQSSEDLDILNKLLNQWTISTAEIVLDEIETRLAVLRELKEKTSDPNTKEVQELQPLFERGLWIFGPEFETIHYTSNKGMNKVIQDLLQKPKTTGSMNRPDFVILPDGFLNCYSIPRFGNMANGDAGEIGVSQLVILELKKPSVKLGFDEVQQPWKYVNELKDKGVIDDRVNVRCFVLGSTMDQNHCAPMRQEKTTVTALTYDTIIQRAESRLFNLDKKIKDALDHIPINDKLLNVETDQCMIEDVANKI